MVQYSVVTVISIVFRRIHILTVKHVSDHQSISNYNPTENYYTQHDLYTPPRTALSSPRLPGTRIAQQKKMETNFNWLAFARAGGAGGRGGGARVMVPGAHVTTGSCLREGGGGPGGRGGGAGVMVPGPCHHWLMIARGRWW